MSEHDLLYAPAAVPMGGAAPGANRAGYWPAPMGPAPGAGWPMPAPAPAPTLGHAPDCAALLRFAMTGATVAASGAAAANIARVQAGELDTPGALAATAEAALVGAAAAAAAGAVAGVVAEQGLAKLVLSFAVGTAVVYGINRLRGEYDHV